MRDHTISEQIFAGTVKRLSNWKHPGPDKLHNYWIKKFASLHPFLMRFMNEFIDHPEYAPSSFTQGITFLKPKVKNTIDPSQFRPITCLNGVYKVFTSCVTELITRHCEENAILNEEQKGCRRGSLGCKEQLIIDSVITEQAIKKNRNLYTLYIDYKKAYDRVPHTWLVQILKLYKVDNNLVKCISALMSTWRTALHVRTQSGMIRSRMLPIKCGIFQGDSLSPLWFALAMNPLSTLLRKSTYGYAIKSGREEGYTLNHLLYVDDLKLYASTDNSLRNLLKVVERFSGDIGMQFGMDKCRRQTIVRGKYRYENPLATEAGELIQPLQHNEVYKYLGIQQAVRIHHTTIKNAIVTEFERRLKAIMGTGLNSGNLTKAINTFAIPILTYTFGVIRWTSTDLQNIGIKIRTTLTKYRLHHPKSSIQRVHLPRDRGGRGIVNVQALHQKQVQSMRAFWQARAPVSELHEAVKRSDHNHTPLNLSEENQDHGGHSLLQQIEEWQQKSLHGRYPALLARDDVDTQLSLRWLTTGSLFPETEGFLVAIQDQVIATRHYRKHILKENGVDEKCRKCRQQPETLDHVLNGCPVLTQSRYKYRHDALGKVIHNSLAVKYGLEDPIPYYKYEPKQILEGGGLTMYWDRSILTDKRIQNNRPDTIIIDKTRKVAFVVDYAVPLTPNLERTFAEKVDKYREVATYLKNAYKLERVDIVPVTISSIGIVPKKTLRSVETLQLPPYVIETGQKAILLETAAIVRETFCLNIS